MPATLSPFSGILPDRADPAAAAPRQLPPDPESLNDCRADWAGKALNAFRAATRCDKEDAVADLISDLAHWCDRNGENFALQLKRAQGHYHAETAGCSR